MATIGQAELETLILNALQHNLMDQEALTVFCEEYAKERNRLQAEATQNRGCMEKELSTTKRDHAKLIDAILAGVPADQVKDRMNALEERRIELEAQLSHAPAPSPLRIHPKMAESYRARVGLLIAQLQQPEGMLEAKEALRGLIDRIVLTPDAVTGRLSLDLEGALARLLWLAVEAEGGVKRQNPAGAGYEVSDIVEELVMVAGARIGHKFLGLREVRIER